ncbi:malectin domain-containing carbohydrate-binding protein [Paraflavisolibacter sp. H34]|uniref:malectin domain-containing carbohydrate-binding protein n=1 Tax=Huijunlia imazamoxiresistens TaxID=3127457 RepID=UPI00301872F2
MKNLLLSLTAVAALGTTSLAQSPLRSDISLDAGWRTTVHEKDTAAFAGFEKISFNDQSWKQVDVPHNWDQYEGYRRLRHGNLHGYAWYRKTFNVGGIDKAKRYFLWFEGVGSYATIWLNGKKVGYHAGGRTSFTLDVTEALVANGKNTLAVRADHPAMINDLPWICGGCSEDRGWSEGSQPLGIFRPVHLVATNSLRIEPFGVHIWNDEKISEKSALLHTTTEVKNYGKAPRPVTVVQRLLDRNKKQVVQVQKTVSVAPGTMATVAADFGSITNPHLWSPQDPYLYTLVTEIREGGKRVDELTTPYGIRWISWPVGRAGGDKRFFLNGKPLFINGTCEYEHLMGQSHAFSAEQVKARVQQIKAAGYNAFRDAHQPHNLRFQQLWDSLGILWWPQLSAHAWYDNPQFKANTKALLTDWIRERRNSPSAILWGLQNESKIPEDFARECTELIRQLDPTASGQRKVTTCNGGSGTDWDVPQNWTGTYGGDPYAYGQDLKRQLLVGEYGAWRSLDLHTSGPFQQNGIYSEDRMTQLMELKVRLAESVKDSTTGHFHWLFGSHENPGRVQGGEGFRELDRVGPVNYKGLLTPWGEPLDVFYMFRANYAPKDKEPMVYLVSHTWADRWTTPGRKNSIVVYSNCDEVELFNDVQRVSLGKRTRNGIGTHFRWDSVDIRYNVLYAEGRVGGKVVARDYIVLNHLPEAPHGKELVKEKKNITAPAPGYNYLYRVNCGGPDYRDANGNVWMADRRQSGKGSWGSLSWTEDFEGMPAYFASQRTTNDPIQGTSDGALFQTFRYGMDKLKYRFPLPDGNYRLELYFTEPWYGTGGGMNCAGWRLFDVAVNGSTVLKNLDIWKEAGHDGALKKTVTARVTGGQLEISFPKVPAGEAILSAIAIATMDKNIQPAPASPLVIRGLEGPSNWLAGSWLTTGDAIYAGDSLRFSVLPPVLYGAEWIRTAPIRGKINEPGFQVSEAADVYVGIDTRMKEQPFWLDSFADAKLTVEAGNHAYKLYHKQFAKGSRVALGGHVPGQTGAGMYTIFVKPVSQIEPAYDLKPTARYEAEEARLTGVAVAPEPFLNKKYVTLEQANAAVDWKMQVGVADRYSLRFRYINKTGKTVAATMKVFANDGTLMHIQPLEFSPTPEKWATVDASTGSFINAGTYTIQLTGVDAKGLGLDYLEVQ